MIPHSLNRRQFVTAVTAASALGAVRTTSAASSPSAPAGSVSVFSKHLQYLGYDALAETAAEAGFDGIDLTVRPEGHVLPERVEDDLPRAAEAARKAGIAVTMMATAIASADGSAERLLKTAADLDIRHYRMAWLPYLEGRSLLAGLDYYREHLPALAAMNRRFGIHGAYQNHAGKMIGGPIWDLYYLVRDLNPEHLGVQYDIRHATVEGGTSWPVDLELIAPLINLLAVKDFLWEKTGQGWRPANVPVGEGMVDYKAFLQQLARLSVRAPISMHFEYPFPGETGPAMSPAARAKEAVRLMRRDRERFVALREEAGWM